MQRSNKIDLKPRENYKKHVKNHRKNRINFKK